MNTQQKKIRVFVVDDSAVVRKLVTNALSSDPDIEVIGTAMDPYIARNKLKDLNPDVITLDIEMPRMDGLTFLELIMEHRPMPVIIMSSLTQRGSVDALEALRLGAIDVLGKPGGSCSFGDLGPQLIEKVKAAAIAKVRRTIFRDKASEDGPPNRTGQKSSIAAHRSLDAKQSTLDSSHSTAAPTSKREAIRPLEAIQNPPPPSSGQLLCRDPKALILLGASTGGTEALADILTRLPVALPPIAIVQHIPAHFSAAFAQRLNRICQLEVREAKDGDLLVPGLALIAPGNFHMMIQRSGDRYRVRVADGPMVWHQRPAVDLLFKSAAEFGSHVLAGLLTGMGKDGAEGLLRLKERGAATFAQDEATSVVYGMPRAAWENGGAQKQLALEKIPEHVISTISAFSPATGAVSGTAV